MSSLGSNMWVLFVWRSQSYCCVASYERQREALGYSEQVASQYQYPWRSAVWLAPAAVGRSWARRSPASPGPVGLRSKHCNTCGPDCAPADGRAAVLSINLVPDTGLTQLAGRLTVSHLNRAVNTGLSKAQAGEIMKHLAICVGWLNVFSALLVVKEVFERRPTRSPRQNLT